MMKSGRIAYIKGGSSSLFLLLFFRNGESADAAMVRQGLETVLRWGCQ